ncbi:MAG: IS630 family transposase, partial [Bacteroidota bacterium]
MYVKENPDAFFKKLKRRWKRYRKSPLGKPDPAVYELKVKQLRALLSLEDIGWIDLLFGDETGFSLEPNIPYGWLPIGKQTSICSEHKHVGNVFGLLSIKGNGHMHWTKKNINSEFIIQKLDQLSDQLGKPTVVVLDNAPWHTSKAVQAKIEQWKNKGLYIFYLPTYSPHLNLIEILWRKIKYEWL